MRRGRGKKWRVPMTVGALAASALPLAACLDRPLCVDCKPVTTNVFVDTVVQKRVDKVDLLFVIDNSSSMADKQQVLSEAVPDLVRRLVSPDCVASVGGVRTPPDARGKCAAGSAPEFDAVKDIHIGVITSSLGGLTCSSGPSTLPEENEQREDRGHLIGTRLRFKTAAGKATGLDAPAKEGFLDWNPVARPGQNQDAFKATFTLMTTSSGERGCGYEAQLESFYRFLIDPVPPASVEVVGEVSVKRGIDQALLDERKAFLRPDSLVAVIMLTDENDCSIRETGQGYWATLPEIQRSSAACGVNPNDPCCYACGQAAPPSCAPDPACGTDPKNAPRVPRDLDHPNLRCYQQKKRFGFDYLYPTARYVNALKKRKLCVSNVALDGAEEGQCPDRDGVAGPDVFDNPLYAGSVASLPRTEELVYLAGIVGVPWQDLAASRDPEGNAYDPNELHYKTATDMGKDGTWDKILGVPRPPNGAPPILPTDRLMVESTDNRGGNDGQGNPLGAPEGAWNSNAINGHEWNNKGSSDLQYACVFPLPPDPVTKERSRDCTKASGWCDCDDRDDEDYNPLCQDPATNEYGARQFRAKAYPGLRELEVLKDFGKNSIVASICARNVEERSRQDYGYRPAVDAIVERLIVDLSDRCLPRVLEKDAAGGIPCSVVEALPPGPAVVCDPARGRLPPSAELTHGVQDRIRKQGRCDAPNQPACSAYRLCQLKEVLSPACHQATNDQPEAGWCYIDPETQPGDDPSLVKGCKPNDRRIMRFVDSEGATPAPEADVFIACFGATGSTAATPVGAMQ
jgi:hypothetical protein